MANKFFVLFKRDIKTEKEKEYGPKMLYDHMAEYPTLAKATEFALEHIPATIVKKLPLTEAETSRIRDSEKPYLVAAQFNGKYHSCCMGETDPMTTFDALRCSEKDLEATVEAFSAEGAEKIIVGAELKVYP